MKLKIIATLIWLTIAGILVWNFLTLVAETSR